MESRKLTKKDVKSVVITFVLIGIFLFGETFPQYKHFTNITLGFLIVFLILLPSFIEFKKIKKQTVRLKDGLFYKVIVDNELLILLNIKTNEKKAMKWSEISDIHIIAIDSFPIGSISYMLRGQDFVLEIPMDAEGSDVFLKKMQNTLPNFDNEILIEATCMLHGSKKLWSAA